MFNRKKFIYAAAFLLATTLTITAIVNYTKINPNATQVNNIVLTEQIEQSGQAYITDDAEKNSDTLNDTETYASETQEDLTKAAEVKIITYTAKSDDTLDSIASTYNLKVNSITESNSLTTNSLLKEGQVLEFPSVDGILYKIKDGETLWDLAILNNIDINKIIEINKLESPEKLKLGQKLIMPDVDAVKPAASSKILSRGGSLPAASTASLPAASSASLPVKGKISSKFGARWGKQHKGIDISAPTGTDVFAPMDGKVSFSGWQGGYGNLGIIDHGNGLQSYYGHNSKLLVNTGKTVSKGTHIAEVGSTGRSTGPHCHFEIRKNGTPVNPYTYVK